MMPTQVCLESRPIVWQPSLSQQQKWKRKSMWYSMGTTYLLYRYSKRVIWRRKGSETRKVEVRARNQELAKMKSLMFYQEQKNKRINKIKSKKFHKIHKKAEERRKEKEREVSVDLWLSCSCWKKRIRPCIVSCWRRMQWNELKNVFLWNIRTHRRWGWREGVRCSGWSELFGTECRMQIPGYVFANLFIVGCH